MTAQLITFVDRFNSERRFFVVSYIASHGLLLLRSPKHRDGYETRLDILMQDVRVLELRVWTDGLSIEEVNCDAIADARTNPVGLIEPGNRVFLLKGAGWEGYVVAGAIFLAEDDGEVGDPSHLHKGFKLGSAIA